VFERRERRAVVHLIDICLDAERGFRVAAEEVATPELKRLFLRLAEQRREFVADLLPQLQRLAGDAQSSGTVAAALHRAWIHLKAHAAADKDWAVIEEVARGERVARAAYDAALKNVTPDTRTLIETHELGMVVAARLVGNMHSPAGGTP
jgi:uncharacterized protein (TIGR02284 family)